MAHFWGLLPSEVRALTVTDAIAMAHYWLKSRGGR